jgi:uncharacterized protein (TIGR02001 family)
MSKAAGGLAFLAVLGMAAALHAQDRAAERWTAPFGGTWSAGLMGVSDYAYRGISLTERQPGLQAVVGWTRPIVADTLDLYLEAYGATVRFAPQVSTEITTTASLILHGFGNRLSTWFSVARYLYPGTPAALGYSYNELTLWANWDFGPFALAGTVSYAPDYYAHSGAGWYKGAGLSLPLAFVPHGKDIGLRAFASIGNQYVERFRRDSLRQNNYWTWEFGLTARVYRLDLTLSYVDTDLDVTGCGNTRNCEGRVVFKVGRTF